MTSQEINDADVFAVPGAMGIIDFARPDGRSFHNGLTLEELRARDGNPAIERFTWASWQAAAAARQQTPITWDETTQAQFYEMLGVLPPIDLRGGAFLVGEASDHCVATGRPRYAAYREIGDRYLVASRPMTRAELRAELTIPTVNKS
jgi:hypothetical protein